MSADLSPSNEQYIEDAVARVLHGARDHGSLL